MELGLFLVSIAVMLASAKIFSELAERIGQPAVLGELIAGIIIGQSLLNFIKPNETLYLLAEIGVIILLFEIGLGTDLREIIKVGHKSMLVALVGVVVPFAAGYFFCRAVGMSNTVAMFIGAALTATSIGITSRVISDIGELESVEARIVIGAAVVDDIIGLILLSVVSGLGLAQGISVLQVLKVVGLSVGFLVVTIFAGNYLVKFFIRIIDRMHVRGILVVSAVIFALLLAYAAKMVGTAVIIGSFAAGLLLARTHKAEVIENRLKPIADFFTPLFFVYMGATMNLRTLNPFNPQNLHMLLIFIGIIVIAIVGKLVSGYAVYKEDVRNTAIGIGMVPRGEVGLIFAEVGRRAGIIGDDFFAGIVLMVFITTLMTPSFLKMYMRPIKPK
jgi:Kef-type K+ transport system membrane component KefB